MKLKCDFVINEVAGKFVAVGVNSGNFEGFLKMNHVGAEILKNLENDITEEEIVTRILDKYPDATKEDAAETVHEFIKKLQETDLLV